VKDSLSCFLGADEFLKKLLLNREGYPERFINKLSRKKWTVFGILFSTFVSIAMVILTGYGSGIKKYVRELYLLKKLVMSEGLVRVAL
jgi:hypothetical protein